METLEKKALKNGASTEIFEDNLIEFNKALTNERFKEKIIIKINSLIKM